MLKISGVSFVNLLVAAALSCGMLAMITKYFLTVKTILVKQQATIDLIQKKELAYNFFKQDIQNSKQVLLATGNKLEAKIPYQKIKPNTSVLLILEVPYDYYYFAKDIIDPCAPIKLIKSNILKPGIMLKLINKQALTDKIIVTNDYANIIFYKTDSSPEQMQNTCLQYKYQAGDQILHYQHLAYYLAKDANNSGQYILFRDNFFQPAIGLIDGITNFQIKNIESHTNFTVVNLFIEYAVNNNSKQDLSFILMHKKHNKL